MRKHVMELRVDQRDHGAGVVLTVSGELDIATVPLLRAAVDAALAASPGLLFLDLTPLSFLDSTGCRELSYAGKAAGRSGIPVALVVPEANKRVRRIVDFMQLDALMPVHDEVPAP